MAGKLKHSDLGGLKDLCEMQQDWKDSNDVWMFTHV